MGRNDIGRSYKVRTQAVPAKQNIEAGETLILGLPGLHSVFNASTRMTCWHGLYDLDNPFVVVLYVYL